MPALPWHLAHDCPHGQGSRLRSNGREACASSSQTRSNDSPVTGHSFQAVYRSEYSNREMIVRSHLFGHAFVTIADQHASAPARLPRTYWRSRFFSSLEANALRRSMSGHKSTSVELTRRWAGDDVGPAH